MQIDKEIAESENEIDILYRNYYGYSSGNREKMASRKQLVLEKRAGRTDELRDLIAQAKKSLAELSQSTLSELLNRDNIDRFMVQSKQAQEFGDVLKNEYFALLKYLIRNGFIGETYSDYMTYFYDGSISVTDKTFLRSITDQEAKEFSHPLRNVATILNRMRDIDFDQIESLNFDLFTHMLQRGNANLPRYIAMMQRNKSSDFVIEYFGKKHAIPELIQNLSKYWPDFFCQSLANRWFEQESQKEYSVNALLYLGTEELQAINLDGCLTEYISQMPNYLCIDNPSVEKLIISFEALRVVFDTIDEEHADPALLNAVYKKNLYVLNADNIIVMLHTQYNIHDEESIMHRNYTIIMSQPDTPISSYVLTHVEDYMQTYLGMCNGWVDDSEISAIAILNYDSISQKTKKKYISFMRTAISDIKTVSCTECWESMFEKDIVVFSEHNVLAMFFLKEELTSLLINYINKTQCAINCDTIQDEYQSNQLIILMEAMLQDDSISNEAFAFWISGLHSLCAEEYDSFEVGTKLNALKMHFLFDQGIIPMTAEGLSFVRQHYPQHIRYFITKQIDEYVAIMSETLFSHEELLNLLTWSEICSNDKLKLLEYASLPIKIIGSNYEDAISLYIVQHNFDTSELPQCLINYGQYGPEIQKAFIKLALAQIDVVIENAPNLDRALISQLLCGEIVIEERIELLIKLMGIWSQEDILQELDNCGLNGYRKLLRPYASKTITADSVSNKLLSAFQAARWIDSYEKDASDATLYRVELLKKKQK